MHGSRHLPTGFGRALCAGFIALCAAVPVAAFSGPHSVDALTIDGGVVTFTDDGYEATYRSVSTGREAVLRLHQISATGTDPDSVEVTLELDYSDGFRATGSGTLTIGTLPPLPGPANHPFGVVYVLGHLTVTGTNRPRAGAWPKVGDELVSAGELRADATVEGAIRIVRPD